MVIKPMLFILFIILLSSSWTCIKLLFNANKENSTYRLDITILLRLLNFVHNIKSFKN